MTRRWSVTAGVTAVAMAVGLAAPAALAAPPPAAERAAMQQILDTLRLQYSAPGAGFTFGDGEGGVGDTTLTSGTGNILANAPIRATDKVRVGSDTKMFVSSVVLQLVGEGVLDLDAPVEQYLPGVLRYPTSKVRADLAPSYDGRAVTLRQLLQHTGGVPDYADLLYVLNPVHQLLAPTPQNLIDYALRKGPNFAPGVGYRYSNTDYTLLGLVVQAVTGRSIGTEIAQRIIVPLGLANTFFAERGQRGLPGAYVHGYLTSLVPVDFSNFEPGVWGAAGALVSTANDMNTFMSALLAGEVLSPDLLAEMQDDIPTASNTGYGLGLVRLDLSCGEAWGHGGYVAGYRTLGVALPNGRHGFMTFNASVVVDLVSLFPASAYTLLDLALC